VRPEVEIDAARAQTDALEEHGDQPLERRRPLVDGHERPAGCLVVQSASRGLPLEELDRELEARERRPQLVRRDRDELVALGDLASLAEAREVVRASFWPVLYEPRDAAAWDEAYGRFEQLAAAEPTGVAA
jgi:hypothetical protein